jgi:hypothetical protein
VNPEEHREITFLLVVRDPRDVAVSAAHYWDWTLDEALDKMIEGPGPLELPPWKVFVESWLEQHVPILRYEDFHHDAKKELTGLLGHLELEPQRDLERVVSRQSFTVKKAELDRRGASYPFGREAQLRHMRKGTVGEWKEAFSPEQVRRTVVWRRQLKKLGY